MKVNIRKSRPGLGLVGSSVKARKSALQVVKAIDARVAKHHAAVALERAMDALMRGPAPAADQGEPAGQDVNILSLSDLRKMETELLATEQVIEAELGEALYAATRCTPERAKSLQSSIADLRAHLEEVREDLDDIQEAIKTAS